MRIMIAYNIENIIQQPRNGLNQIADSTMNTNHRLHTNGIASVIPAIRIHRIIQYYEASLIAWNSHCHRRKMRGRRCDGKRCILGLLDNARLSRKPTVQHDAQWCANTHASQQGTAKDPNHNRNNLNKLGFLDVPKFLDNLSNLHTMHASNKNVQAPINPQ